jgi:primosomal protein N' (replication factor Y) (superfamily II helicase)
MRAEVLVLRRTRLLAADPALFSYAVPPAIRDHIRAGQLAAVPFGERFLPGIVWALDAADDVGGGLPPDGETSARRDETPRALAALLLAEPLLSPERRALAEWLADYYAAPLAEAARLFLPPGLTSGMRVMLQARGAADGGASGAEERPEELEPEAASALALIRGRGRVEQRALARGIGARRAQAVIAQLEARGEIMRVLEVPAAVSAGRRERIVSLAAAPAALDAWRALARSALDGLPAPPKRRPTWQTPNAGERQAERLLRQLAALDVLARVAQADDAEGELHRVWRVEELRRLTRVTAAALAELAEAGLVRIVEIERRYDPQPGRVRAAPSAPLALTHAQSAALTAIVAALPTSERVAPESRGQVLLLHGITGSGKTEIYLQALSAAIARGRTGIVLVPEIALTPQAVARFAGRFPGRVALLHSGLTQPERQSEWRRIRDGEVEVVIGSRSALFAPLPRLGLIVVDEEHEAAYKQERRPTYHAREVAVRLGALTGAAVVLGSATPSVESYQRALDGHFTLLELRERAPAALLPTTVQGAFEPPRLPPVTLVDLRAELRAGNTSILSTVLHEALAETVARGEQAILFLNRRGTASAVVCRECGFAMRCDRCDVALTYHAAAHALICHYCGRHEPEPRVCPICHSAGIRYFGLGTERVESAVKRQFPAARVLRWDRDTARTRQAHEALLSAFSERRADILVGTQMIAKGLDLPAVTLVGVVSADIALFMPDFRASERAFQLLTQVAGRAGRGERPGRVLVQTFNPDHFCIQSAARHDYAAFFAAEASARRRFGYPPFRRFVKLTYEHRDRYAAQLEATALAERLERVIRECGLPDTDLVGPAPAFLERLRGRYRWQVILRSPDPRPALRALAGADLPHGWSVDVDPASTL